MTARLRILKGGAERAIDVGAEATIGRAAGQTVRIVEDDLAPEHAVLVFQERWELLAHAALDVDGAPLAAGARAALAPGARITIAGWTIVVETAPAGAAPADPVRTASLARELVRELLGGEAASPSLRITKGPGTGQSLIVPPPPGRLVIGRGDDADVVVLDQDLSRAHVCFERGDDGVRVRDLGSKNGSKVNGAALRGDRLLVEGDEITAGATAIVFTDPAERYLRELEPAPPAPPRRPLAPILIGVAIAVLALLALLWLLV